jgi:hypothetical protein
LVIAKARLTGRGEYGDFLRAAGIGPSTAANFVKIATRWRSRNADIAKRPSAGALRELAATPTEIVDDVIADVAKFPEDQTPALLSTGLIILAFISLTCGVILETVTYGRLEMRRLAYLGMSSIHPPGPFIVERKE